MNKMNFINLTASYKLITFNCQGDDRATERLLSGEC